MLLKNLISSFIKSPQILFKHCHHCLPLLKTVFRGKVNTALEERWCHFSRNLYRSLHKTSPLSGNWGVWSAELPFCWLCLWVSLLLSVFESQPSVAVLCWLSTMRKQGNRYESRQKATSSSDPMPPRVLCLLFLESSSFLLNSPLLFLQSDYLYFPFSISLWVRFREPYGC